MFSNKCMCCGAPHENESVCSYCRTPFQKEYADDILSGEMSAFLSDDWERDMHITFGMTIAALGASFILILALNT